MSTYYKAVRRDGSSFAARDFRWLPEDGVVPPGGFLVEHPNPAKRYSPSAGVTARRYLSVATVATMLLFGGLALVGLAVAP